MVKYYMKQINDTNILDFAKRISLIAILVYFSIIMYYKLNFKDLGTIGDYFGGLLNPVFSFLALIILIKTLSETRKQVNVSKKELELSREVLIATKTELEETKVVHEEQLKTNRIQRFENTFFKLLNNLNYIQPTKDDDLNAIDMWVRSMNTIIKDNSKKDHFIEFLKERDLIQNILRNIVTIIKYVENNENLNKSFYYDLLNVNLNLKT